MRFQEDLGRTKRNKHTKALNNALPLLLSVVSVALMVFGCGGGPGGKGPPDPNDITADLEYDPRVTFPLAEFEKSDTLIRQRKFKEAEQVLMSKFLDARKAKPGSVLLGRYYIRLLTSNEGLERYEKAIQFGEKGLQILYALPADKRGTAVPFFVGHSRLGQCYMYLGKLDEAERQFKKTINVAASAPKSEIDQEWLKGCYVALALVLHQEQKLAQEKIVKKEAETLFKKK